jgi:hypothetical protein
MTQGHDVWRWTVVDIHIKPTDTLDRSLTSVERGKPSYISASCITTKFVCLFVCFFKQIFLKITSFKDKFEFTEFENIKP